MTTADHTGPGQPGFVAPPPAAPLPEDELWTGSPSWKGGLGSFVLAAVATVAIIVLWAFIRQAWMQWPCLAAIGAAWVWALLKAFFPCWATRYRLTSQRLFIRRGVLSQVTDQTELIRVDDVEVRRSLFQRMLGLGDAVVLSADKTDSDCVLRNIVKAEHVAEMVRDHTRRLRQRSLYVENI